MSMWGFLLKSFSQGVNALPLTPFGPASPLTRFVPGFPQGKQEADHERAMEEEQVRDNIIVIFTLCLSFPLSRLPSGQAGGRL